MTLSVSEFKRLLNAAAFCVVLISSSTEEWKFMRKTFKHFSVFYQEYQLSISVQELIEEKSNTLYLQKRYSLTLPAM